MNNKKQVQYNRIPHSTRLPSTGSGPEHVGGSSSQAAFSIPIFILFLILVPCALFLVPCTVYAADVTLAWDANTGDDVAGYKIYYGTSSRNYSTNVDVGDTTERTITGLNDDTIYYFAATAYDSNDNESAFSEEVVHIIGNPNNPPAKPNTPTGPSSGYPQISYSYNTSGTDPDGDLLEYRFDWGDGNISGWGGASNRTHAWSSTGNFCIKAQTKDTHGATSGWSACRTTNITIAIDDGDGDGVPDDQDDFPFDPDEWLDTDGDGTGNNADADDDEDGIPDVWEDQYGLNPLSDDAGDDLDGDGVSNIDEYVEGTDPTIDDYNDAPDAPSELSPDNNDPESLLPVLQTAEFYDSDNGDSHLKTHWQIFDQLSGKCVLDIETPTSLTMLTVPRLILDENTTYYWKVRFFDNHGAASDWSESAVFLTDMNNEDLNGNGIPDHQELVDPTDMDMDGVPDAEQDDIKCVLTEDGNSFMGISFKDSPTVVAIDSIVSQDPMEVLPDSAFPGQPAALPFDLIHFKLLMDEPGDEAEITIYFSQIAPRESIWFKYDPVELAWQDYSDYATLEPGRQYVTLILKDGGIGDADGTENGVIIDPAGIGVAAATSESDDNDGDDWSDDWRDKISDLGDDLNVSCFIATAAHQATNTQPTNLWREIRGRELSIIFIMVVVIFAGRLMILRVKRSYGKCLKLKKYGLR